MSNAVATNKKAFRDYFVLERFEAGIALTGSEVKSIRAGKVSLDDSYCKIERGEALLYNAYVNPYAFASYLNVESTRARRLLMHKKEIVKLISETSQKGLTIVPLRIYFNSRGFAKVEIALAKGKKEHDRREDIKNRAIDRKIKQVLKNRNQR